MNTATVTTIQVDKKIKDQAETFARKQGTTITQLINQFLNQIVTTKGKVISEPEEKLMPTPYLEKILKKARKNRLEGKGSPVFDNAKDAIAFLHEQIK